MKTAKFLLSLFSIPILVSVFSLTVFASEGGYAGAEYTGITDLPETDALPSETADLTVSPADTAGEDIAAAAEESAGTEEDLLSDTEDIPSSDAETVDIADESEDTAVYSEEELAFLNAVYLAGPAYIDPATGATYTTTASGVTVGVDAASYMNALLTGDAEAYLAILNAQSRSFYWDGSILTALGGINEGPSGTEVYYSLDMSTCVAVLEQDYGETGQYWIREDGCQMYGIYILCAANYGEHAPGTLVETSLGTAIVADTGSFSGMIDIATSWAW